MHHILTCDDHSRIWVIRVWCLGTGMLPLMLSERLLDSESRRGWFRTGTDVCYYKNPWCKPGGRASYSLSFSVRFPDDGPCYLAYSVPYSHSTDLKKDLEAIMQEPERRQWVTKMDTMCRTLAGEPVPLLEISEPTDEVSPQMLSMLICCLTS